ncbi:hypothetical protein GCM10027446_32150 [Angustibacter peucedani]
MTAVVLTAAATGLLCGAAVLVGGRAARRPLPTPRRPDPVVPRAAVTVAVLVDLVRAALEAGLPTASALEAVRTVAPSTLDDAAWRALASSTPPVPEVAGLARALALADRTGASVGVLLRRAADDERAARRRRASVAAGRLGVRLVLPLGLTTLPAFVLLGVAPVVIGLAADVLGAP